MMLRALIACTALMFAAAGDPPAQVGGPKPNQQQKASKPPMLTSASIDSSDPDGSAFDSQALTAKNPAGAGFFAAGEG